MLFFTICRHSDPKSTVKVSRQLLRAMKLTSLLLVAACMNVSASGYGQKVTISGKDLPLEKVFSMIKRQTGYAFFYDYNIFQDTKPVTLNLKDADIEDAMRVCLWGQDLDFSIMDKTISVVKKAAKKNDIGGDSGPDRTVKAMGVVLNEGGQPLSGATVTSKQSQKSTLTNAKGEFELSNVPVNSELVVSYVGYSPYQLTVKESETIHIRMSLAVNKLDETIVQAYGTTTRRLSTGNIAKVSSEEIERQPVVNPLLAMQGKVAGLDINQTNGFATAPVKVELRGRNTINGAFMSDPLYIVDGVPLTILEVGGYSSYNRGSTGFDQTGMSPAAGQSPFFNLNPMDIESIEILKDADATAIYGSRGANGVILISTKKGKAGKTKLDIRIQDGISKQTRFYDLMNTQQYLQMRRQALKNDGISPSISHGDYDLLLWDTTRYTNWQKAIYGGTGKNLDAQLGISGGDVHTTFRLGAGYNRTTNILTVSGADQRGALSFNVNHRSNDQRLSISFTNGYSFTQSDMVSLPAGILLPPNAPAIYDSAGNLNYNGWGGANSGARRAYPFASLQRPYTAKTNFLNSNLVFVYQPIKGLKLSSSFGYNYSQANQSSFRFISSYDPLSNPTGSSQLGFNNIKNWIIEPQANYDVVISKGKLGLLLGATVQKTTTYALINSGSGFTSDDLIHSISNAPNLYNSESYAEYKYAHSFGRISYNWENKYIININLARDGSSRFGPGKQFGNFGSVGAAWIFTEEDFISKKLPFLSFGKLRMSYGTTGSDAIGEYQYLSQWTSNNSYPYDNASTLIPIIHYNPDFHWQVNKKLEGAIDLGFFNNRINLLVAYYRDRCGDQLIGFPTPELSGFTSVTANSPALVQNSGWEFSMGAKIINTKKFGWSISVNAAVNKNKLLAYPNISQSPYASTLIVGQSLNIVRVLHFTGVDPLTGQYSFQDINHDGKITYNFSGTGGDDTYGYDKSPKIFGGIGMDFNYKSIQVSLFFNCKKQIGPDAIHQINSTPGTIGNKPTMILGKQWQQPGDIASVARFSTQALTSQNNFYNSDGGYTDASFIRLSNLSISYAFPLSYVRKIGMSGCNVFVHTNNIFTITKYKGLDPETQNFNGMPPAKIIVGGLTFNF